MKRMRRFLNQSNVFNAGRMEEQQQHRQHKRPMTPKDAKAKSGIKSKLHTSFEKWRELFRKPTLMFEFQTEAIKLLVYNYAIVLLIANQEIGWNYPFKEVEIANRMGQELINPAILSKFGLCFRMLTVIINTLALLAVIRPEKRFRKYLLVPILWNVYTIAAIAENILHICWTMYILEVPYRLFATIFIVGIFMVCLQSKLTLQVLRFYEYLNYLT